MADLLLTSLDLTKQVNMLFIQHKQTKQTKRVSCSMTLLLQSRRVFGRGCDQCDQIWRFFELWATF